MEERDQGAKLQPARSAPPAPLGGPVRSAPSRPPGDVARSRPRPSSTGPGPLKTQDNTNTYEGRPQITIISARPMSEVNFSGTKLPDPSVSPVDRNGSIPSNANGLPANKNAPSIPMNRPKENYVPPPLPTSRPKVAYTPPSRTNSIRSSSVSSQSSSSQAVSPTEQMSQEQSNNGSVSVGSELLTANKSEPPKRPTSGPHFPNPSPSPSSAANSPAEVSSSENLNPTPRPRIRSISEKSQSGKEATPDDVSSIKKSEDSTEDNPPSAPPPLPTNRPSRKYTVVRPTSIEATKASEKADNVNSNSSKDTTSNKSESTPIPNERQTAVGELGKALEANQKPVPPHTAVKPPKPATKPDKQPKPTPKPTASVAFPPPPSSPKSEHKFNSPLARPRPRVTSTNSEESSEVTESYKDSNSSVVVPSAISVTAAIKGLNSKISAKTNNSIKSSTNRTVSPVNTEQPKPALPENTSHSKNPFSLAKPTLNRASPSSEISTSADKGSCTRVAQPVPTPRGMQNAVTIDANTISTASKGLSAFSSTMSGFENQPKPQGQSSRPPPPKWNGQVPDAATLSLAASGMSAMSSVAASASKFQSNIDRPQPSTYKTSVSQPTPSIPDAATISAAAKGLSFLSSVSSSQSRPVPTARAPSLSQNTNKTSVSQPTPSIPDAATISAAAKGLSFFSSVSSSQPRPVPTARVSSSSQNTMSTSMSLNSINQKPLIPQKTAQFNVPSQSAMKDIASMFDPIATTTKPQQEKTPASRNSDLLLALGGGKMSTPTRKAPSIPKSKPKVSPTPTRKQTSTPPVNQTSNTNTSLLQPKAAVRPTIIRPSAKPSNKKKAPPRPSTGPNLKTMKAKAAPRQPMQASAMKNSKKPNAKTKRPAPARPGPPPPAVSGLPPRPGPGHPLFKYTVEKPHSIAQFSFQATNSDELSFEENDVIILLREVNADWFCGRNKDKEGIFPKNFVRVIKPLSSEEKEKEKEIEEISGPCAVALHAYQSDAADDLCFDAGDNIQLLERMNDQWYKGECNGNTGMFPKNFVEVIEDIPESVQIKVDSPVSSGSGPRCKARFDYESDEPSDLTFEEGTLIKLVARVGDEWLKGELNGRAGIFPQAYVEIIEDLAGGPDNDDGIVMALFDFDGADSSELSFKMGDKIFVKSRINSEWLVGELNGNEGSFPANFVDNIPANLPSAANSPCNMPSDDAAQGTCTAVFDFDAGDEDELSIRTGDTITIVEAVGDDWLRGRLNGKEGIFPRNFVEMQEGGSGAKMTVKALFDFPAKMHDDLGFKVNDIITDVVSVSDDWYEGSLNGKVGRFPSNFVEVISS
ncbi:SH3 domain-containing protein 19-like isoform X2 [Anneissia japonica]|uniref:SH3 domain-containing protein 19-like isoform X2 n=1 Tax=Anneissia japonica TaxID=1529436 RepID=UPI00142566F6|nr:SH3 domain-containing protein 19-like isoform X2 [Anneissia japonica]